MLKNEARKKIILSLIATVSILLNLYTFVQAYPETFGVDSGCCSNQILAKDFSAYYTAGWRLFHDPSNLYTQGIVNDGEYAIYPQPEPFKYLPSFLIFVCPLLFLNYHEALIAFDTVQFLMLPLLAFLVYALLRDRGIFVIAVVIVISILQPSPTPHWGLSVSYFWQWAEGQDKVLNTTLLLLSFYFGQTDRPILSGVVLGFGAFDPRFFLLSIPLFIIYNRSNLKRSFLSLIASLVALNFPLLVDGICVGFLRMVIQRGAATPIYYYALIPFITLASLIVLNIKQIYILLVAFLSQVSQHSRMITTWDKMRIAAKSECSDHRPASSMARFRSL
jgi:hypothetical protein